MMSCSSLYDWSVRLTAEATSKWRCPMTSGVRIVEPLGYLEFLSLLADAAGALTDSGGIQEETTFLGVPCLTLRDNTERPVTVDMGTNVLLGLRPERIAEAPALIEEVRSRDARIPPGWDGRASGRIADVLGEAGTPASG